MHVQISADGLGYLEGCLKLGRWEIFQQVLWVYCSSAVPVVQCFSL